MGDILSAKIRNQAKNRGVGCSPHPFQPRVGSPVAEGLTQGHTSILSQ